ncbi:MAG TPA: hypothetical protein VNO52_08695 [Methylomirabilota bacterium]|nr:hypothetical protein [Methylomirabilota bacterium]
MSLLALRTAAVNGIRSALNPVKVDSHPGRFDLAELGNYATGAPVVLVAITSVSSVAEDSTRQADCQLAAYILTRPDREHRADERALIIASAVLAAVDGQAWGVDGAQGARELRWQNLYGTEDTNRGVHLSAVTWRQPLQLTDEAVGLPDFELLAAQYNLGPDPDAQIEAEDHIPLNQES